MKENMDRLAKIIDLVYKYKNLRKVAEEIGVSNQRIDQILIKNKFDYSLIVNLKNC